MIKKIITVAFNLFSVAYTCYFTLLASCVQLHIPKIHSLCKNKYVTAAVTKITVIFAVQLLLFLPVPSTTGLSWWHKHIFVQMLVNTATQEPYMISVYMIRLDVGSPF